MVDTFDLAIAKFEEASTRFAEGGAKVIDEALVPLMLHHDKRCIRPLLLLLDDAAQQDEGMFSIIHAAEAFDDATYVNDLLAVLPKLRAKAPKWASIVLMRVMNNEKTKDVLVRTLREADSEVKECVIWLCERINERSPSFLDRTLPVLLAARLWWTPESRQ